MAVSCKSLYPTGISYPVKINQIPKFEQQNKIRVNIFGFDCVEKNTCIFPRYISNNVYENTVNLLLISNDQRSHYILIKNINGLLRNKTNHGSGMKYCLRCLQNFSSPKLLEIHTLMCAKKEIQTTTMPTENTMKFTNYKYMKYNIITVYVDWEALLVPYSHDVGEKTELTHKHVPCGYGYKVVSPYKHLNKPVKIYRGEDCADRFIEDMIREYKEVEHILTGNVPMIFTEEDEIKFKNSKICRVCNKPLDWCDKKNYVVRDHDHVTGKYRLVNTKL